MLFDFNKNITQMLGRHFELRIQHFWDLDFIFPLILIKWEFIN